MAPSQGAVGHSFVDGPQMREFVDKGTKPGPLRKMLSKWTKTFKGNKTSSKKPQAASANDAYFSSLISVPEQDTVHHDSVAAYNLLTQPDWIRHYKYAHQPTGQHSMTTVSTVSQTSEQLDSGFLAGTSQPNLLNTVRSSACATVPNTDTHARSPGSNRLQIDGHMDQAKHTIRVLQSPQRMTAPCDNDVNNHANQSRYPPVHLLTASTQQSYHAASTQQPYHAAKPPRPVGPPLGSSSSSSASVMTNNSSSDSATSMLKLTNPQAQTSTSQLPPASAVSAELAATAAAAGRQLQLTSASQVPAGQPVSILPVPQLQPGVQQTRQQSHSGGLRAAAAGTLRPPETAATPQGFCNPGDPRLELPPNKLPPFYATAAVPSLPHLPYPAARLKQHDPPACGMHTVDIGDMVMPQLANKLKAPLPIGTMQTTAAGATPGFGQAPSSFGNIPGHHHRLTAPEPVVTCEVQGSREQVAAAGAMQQARISYPPVRDRQPGRSAVMSAAARVRARFAAAAEAVQGPVVTQMPCSDAAVLAPYTGQDAPSTAANISDTAATIGLISTQNSRLSHGMMRHGFAEHTSSEHKAASGTHQCQDKTVPSMSTQDTDKSLSAIGDYADQDHKPHISQPQSTGGPVGQVQALLSDIAAEVRKVALESKKINMRLKMAESLLSLLPVQANVDPALSARLEAEVAQMQAQHASHIVQHKVLMFAQGEWQAVLDMLSGMVVGERYASRLHNILFSEALRKINAFKSQEEATAGVPSSTKSGPGTHTRHSPASDSTAAADGPLSAQAARTPGTAATSQNKQQTIHTALLDYAHVVAVRQRPTSAMDPILISDLQRGRMRNAGKAEAAAQPEHEGARADTQRDQRKSLSQIMPALQPRAHASKSGKAESASPTDFARNASNYGRIYPNPKTRKDLSHSFEQALLEDDLLPVMPGAAILPVLSRDGTIDDASPEVSDDVFATVAELLQSDTFASQEEGGQKPDRGEETYYTAANFAQGTVMESCLTAARNVLLSGAFAGTGPMHALPAIPDADNDLFLSCFEAIRTSSGNAVSPAPVGATSAKPAAAQPARQLPQPTPLAQVPAAAALQTASRGSSRRENQDDGYFDVQRPSRPASIVNGGRSGSNVLSGDASARNSGTYAAGGRVWHLSAPASARVSAANAAGQLELPAAHSNTHTAGQVAHSSAAMAKQSGSHAPGGTSVANSGNHAVSQSSMGTEYSTGKAGTQPAAARATSAPSGDVQPRAPGLIQRDAAMAATLPTVPWTITHPKQGNMQAAVQYAPHPATRQVNQRDRLDGSVGNLEVMLQAVALLQQQQQQAGLI